MKILYTLLLLLITLHSCKAFRNGAGSCDGGQAAVDEFHLSTSNNRDVTTGSLADGNLSVTINSNGGGATLDPNTPMPVMIGQEYTLTVSGDTPYRGFLFRFESQGAGAPHKLGTTNINEQGLSDMCEGATLAATHINNELKNNQSVRVTANSEALLLVDITIVVSNSIDASIYYYSGFTLEPVASTVTFSPTVTPTDPPAPTMEARTEVPEGTCNICGGGRVGSEESTYSFAGVTKTCGEFQDDGRANKISSEACSNIPDGLRQACQCPGTGGDNLAGDSLPTPPSAATSPSPMGPMEPVGGAPLTSDSARQSKALTGCLATMAVMLLSTLG